MNREVVRKLVQVYIDRNKLSNPEFAKQAKINDRTVRRLLNSEDSISDQTLEKNGGCLRKNVNLPSSALARGRFIFGVNITLTAPGGSMNKQSR